MSYRRGLRGTSFRVVDRAFLHETLTVLRLGVPPTLARTLRSTNAIESMISVCREHAGNVKRWREGQMALRWCAAGMIEAEKAVWNRIQTLVARFKRADRIVLGVPMWNFAYPYKLKQLIDLVSQRNMLFTYDGERFGPLLQTPRAMVIYTRGQEYREDLPTPPSRFDHQSGYVEFWLHFIGVPDVRALAVENTWGRQRILSQQPLFRHKGILICCFTTLTSFSRIRMSHET